jgi:hypothetical protein
VVSPTVAASSARLGETSAFPSVVMTTGTALSSRPAAASNRPDSGSSTRCHRYGTRLRARKSRTANDGADQRWPMTRNWGTAASGAAVHISSRSSKTGYSFSSGGCHGLSR